MGITSVRASVSSLVPESRSAVVDFVVDSGAVYSVVPRRVLEDLGIEPAETRSFFLADGHQIKRQMGLAVFEYLGHRTAAPVIFGDPADSAVMGATTLEGFGFVLDPFRRELRPAIMRMLGRIYSCPPPRPPRPPRPPKPPRPPRPAGSGAIFQATS